MLQLRKVHFCLVLLSFILIDTINCDLSRSKEHADNDDNSPESYNETDVVPQDLYVIKTVVYEVGILTDVANDTDNSTETHEQVDVSFYNPSKDGAALDLSHIPVPVQTNVSGVSVTGLVPSSDLVSILLPPDEKEAPVLPKKQLTVTQNLSTTDPEKGAEIISNLPKLLGLTTKRPEGHESRKEEAESGVFALE